MRLGRSVRPQTGAEVRQHSDKCDKITCVSDRSLWPLHFLLLLDFDHLNFFYASSSTSSTRSWTAPLQVELRRKGLAKASMFALPASRFAPQNSIYPNIFSHTLAANHSTVRQKIAAKSSTRSLVSLVIWACTSTANSTAASGQIQMENAAPSWQMTVQTLLPTFATYTLNSLNQKNFKAIR